MSLRAFVSSRVVTPEGMRPAAVMVEGERIRSVVPAEQVPSHAETLDFRDAAILPGLVDSHVHINDPGRADWEGFETATRAAAAGGYTLLVDMPLKLPAGYHRCRGARSETQSGTKSLSTSIGRLGEASSQITSSI